MEKHSIFIVEDEAIISLGIQNELESLGYSIAGSAYKGDEALHMAASIHPDLVLMDINLRGNLDGIETALQLRNQYQIPIVFLTGAVDAATVERAKVVEPYGYILKPFRVDDLRITIEHALNKHQLEVAAHQSEARFRELFETSQDGIVITDMKANILDSNPAFLKVLGYRKEELQNLSITHLTPPEYAEQENKIIKGQVLIRGYSDEIKKEYWRQDGSRLAASVRIWLRKDPTGRPAGFWAIIRDITLEKAAEQRILRQSGFSQKLAKFTELLNAQLELSTVLEIICAEIVQALHVEAAQVTLYDPNKDELAIVHYLGPIDAQELKLTPYPKAMYNRFNANDNAYLVIPDVQSVLTEHPYFSFLVKHNIRTAVIVNLNREAQLIGTLDLATIGNIRQFDQEELTFLVTYANHAAIAIDRARMYQQTKRRTQDLEVLAHLTTVLRLANSSQEMLPTLLNEAVGLAKADAGMIYLLGRAGNPIASYQTPTNSKQGPDWFTPSGALWARMLSSPELLIDSFAEIADSSLLDPPIQLRILVPFQSTNTLAAIMVLGYQHPYQLGIEDRNILTSLAEMGGNALHRSGLLELLEQRVGDRTRELSALYDLTVFVNSSLGLDEVLNEALRKIVDTSYASSGVIYRYHPDTHHLKLETQVNLPVHLIPAVDMLQLSDELIQWLETSRNPWLAFKNDTQSKPIHMPGANYYETVINVPIRFEGITLGLLTVVWLEEHDPTAESIAFLSTVAERLGSAIQNDLLRQKSEQAAVLEERQRLARELHDSVTQSLYSLTLLAEAGKDLLAKEDLIRLKKCLNDLAGNSIQALKEMRMLLFELRPPQHGDQGLAKSLHDRLNAVEQRAGVQTSLVVEESWLLPSGVQEELYWVASEALNNSLKHSGASTVAVTLQSAESGFQLIIEDNGRGFSLETNRSGGIGLNTMRERVERLGGLLEIGSAPGQGTRVSININRPGDEPWKR